MRIVLLYRFVPVVLHNLEAQSFYSYAELWHSSFSLLEEPGEEEGKKENKRWQQNMDLGTR